MSSESHADTHVHFNSIPKSKIIKQNRNYNNYVWRLEIQYNEQLCFAIQSCKPHPTVGRSTVFIHSNVKSMGQGIAMNHFVLALGTAGDYLAEGVIHSEALFCQGTLSWITYLLNPWS
jgi:hypothetical protein